ncbi:MAG: hypothetical protein SPG61_05990, partial [Arcanobacterium sp.]|nr:hypothetical protein [Arcanobacterium sp.]
LRALRKVKTEAKVSQRVPFEYVTLEVPAELANDLELAREDIARAANIEGEFKIVTTEKINDNDNSVNVSDYLLLNV